jgi:hypothetical protein
VTLISFALYIYILPTFLRLTVCTGLTEGKFAKTRIHRPLAYATVADFGYIFLPLLRRFNPAEPVVEKSVIL